ncbi:MAG: GHKL domain-containing protein [Lachnospiraceae bacterium]|nr:GHKL domain-containing protein [Lachnospiraceae bacterium]
MTDWVFLLSDTAAAGIRIIVCLFLMSRLLSADKPDKKSIAAGIFGAIIISILSFLIGLPNFFRLTLETIWIVFCTNHFQNIDTRISLFISIYYEIAVAFWCFLSAAWLGVAFSSPAFLDYKTGNGQIAFWLLHILLAALTFCLYKHHDMTAKEGFRIASAIVLIGLLAIITLSEQTTLTIPDDTLYTWTILSVVLMMSVLMFNMNRQYEAEKELTKLKSEQAELLERDYTTLNNAYAINAKLFHDFHNHIGVLRQLLSHEKITEAVQYLDELQAPTQEMADTVWTGDETVDYLINSKTHTAKADGIQLQVQVEFPRHTNIRNADLCAILGNLLDNAIEAARQIPEPEQSSISLTIRRINQMLIIKVENNFSVPPASKDGSLKTTKTDRNLHGWGLKSAQTAAEKYDGTIRTSYTGNTFRAVATLSYQGILIE